MSAGWNITRTKRTGAITVAAATIVLAAVVPMAGAHGGAPHAHDVPIPANPETTITGGGATGAAPAVGAQPTPPGGAPTPTAAATPAPTGAQGTGAAAAPGAGRATDPAAPAATPAAPKADLGAIAKPVGEKDHSGHASPAPAPAPAPVPVTASGGGANTAPAPPSVAGGGGAPAGELPFTGSAQALLAVLLAGMLVPIGVLLYCGAHHGDRRLQLAMPRFAWAPATSELPVPVSHRHHQPAGLPAQRRAPHGVVRPPFVT